MKATQGLQDAGQSLWLDNITRSILPGGTMRRYVEEFSITGLTSNPTLPRDGGDAEVVLRQFARAGIDADALADTRRQQEGADAFVQSWNDLLACLKEKSGAVARVG